MTPRYFLPLLLALFVAAPASAQLVIGPDDNPFYDIGTDSPYEVLYTENENGQNTAAIEALIDADGANQTFDFTTIDFEENFAGTISVESGAVGPGADLEPLNDATHTLILPFEFEGAVVESYDYFQVTNDANYDLGVYAEGEVDGEEVAFALLNLPDGALSAEFPFTFGDSWMDSYTEEFRLPPVVLTTEVDTEVEVDAWGTLIVPGGRGGVPALRLKVTEEREGLGGTTTLVYYTFVSTEPVTASITEGDEFSPVTAEVATFEAGSSSAEDGSDVRGVTLDAPRPNPTRGTSRLVYHLPEAAPVELVVYDVLGREVQRLVEAPRGAGQHTAVFDADALPAGLYVVRLTVAGQVRTRMLTLVR